VQKHPNRSNCRAALLRDLTTLQAISRKLSDCGLSDVQVVTSGE